MQTFLDHIRGDRSLPGQQMAEDFKDNFALKDIISSGAPKLEYSVCRKTKLTEEFYCIECREMVCTGCMDSSHSGHCFKRIPIKMYRQSVELAKFENDADIKIEANNELMDALKATKQSNQKNVDEAPMQIDRLFDRMIVDLCNSRDHLKELITEEHKRKTHSIEDLQTRYKDQFEVLNQFKTQLSNLNKFIKESAYQENEDHIAQADSLEMDVKVALKDFNHAERIFYKNNLVVDTRVEKIKTIARYLRSNLPLKILADSNPFTRDEDYYFDSQSADFEFKGSKIEKNASKDKREEYMRLPLMPVQGGDQEIRNMEEEFGVSNADINFMNELNEENGAIEEHSRSDEPQRRLEPERRQLRYGNTNNRISSTPFGESLLLPESASTRIQVREYPVRGIGRRSGNLMNETIEENLDSEDREDQPENERSYFRNMNLDHSIEEFRPGMFNRTVSRGRSNYSDDAIESPYNDFHPDYYNSRDE